MSPGDGDLDPIPDHYEQQAAQLGRTSLDDVAKPQSSKITAAPPTPQGDNQSHDDTERGLLANSSRKLIKRAKTDGKIDEEKGEEDNDEEEKKE